ncbi:MAG: gliding motility-associated C-terminal domain-containing protein [Bacteroidetes bacterium]|nr:gliding motility-associated C-terminal domain-containing protein [Bacteroidota bacterium]
MNFLSKLLVTIALLIFATKAYSGNPQYWAYNGAGSFSFIQNNGQFNYNPFASGKIVAGTDHSNLSVFITDSAEIIYKLTTIKKENRLRNYFMKFKKEEKEKQELITEYVKIRWIGANKNFSIKGIDTLPLNYMYVLDNGANGRPQITCRGVRKIVLENIYPNINVEYLVDSSGKIKYNIILLPGAKSEQIALEYNGTTNVQITNTGNLQIRTKNGKITESAPKSFLTQKQQQVFHPSNFMLNKNIVRFQVQEYNNSDTLVIDPWIYSNTGTFDSYFTLDVDSLENTYVLEAINQTTTVWLNKLDMNGALQWRLYITGATVADVKTTHGGTSYVAAMSNSGGPSSAIASVSTHGQVNWIATVNTLDLFEVWDIDFNCKTNGIAAGVGSTQSGNACFAVFDSTTKTISNKVSGSGIGGYDMGSITIDETNGDIFGLGVDAASQRFMRVDKNLNILWNIQIPTISNGGNNISNFDKYVFFIVPEPFYKNYYLYRCNKSNGAINASVPLSMGIGNQVAITIDKCGNIFAYGDTAIFAPKILVFDTALNLVNQLAAPLGASCIRAVNGNLYACGYGDYSSNPSSVYKISSGVSCSEDTLLITTKAFAACGNSNGSAQVLSVAGGLPAYSFQWSNGSTNANSGALSVGNHFVQVKDNSCIVKVDTAYVAIGVAPAISTSLAFTSPSCNADSNGTGYVSIISGVSPFTIQWTNTVGVTISNNDTVKNLIAGLYYVQITDSNNCILTDTLSLTEPAPLLASTIGNSFACGNDSTYLVANAMGGNGGYTYTWLPFAINSGTLQTSISTPVNYTLNITDSKGCSVNYYDTLAIFPKPVIDFMYTDSSVCLGNCILFKPISNINYQLNWAFGDGVNSLLDSVLHCYNTTGIYDLALTATDSKGCTATVKKNNAIAVSPLPSVDFMPSTTQTELIDPIIYFTNQTNGATWYQWDFGEKNSTTNSATSFNASHAYSDTGNYCINLIATTNMGCIDSTKKCIRIKPSFSFYAPNSITPNSDGLNDYFNGKGIGITSYQLWIFDRWGNIIYTTGKTTSPDTATPWDGKVAGGTDLAQEGVYVWKVSLKDVFGKQHSYSGHVSLIR